MATATALGLALAATHGVIDVVHDHAADMRATALPAGAASLAALDVHVIDIADLADGGVAGFLNPADFATGHLDEGITGFAVIENDELTGGAGDLAAATGGDFHVVDRGAEGDGAKGKSVAEIGGDVVAGDDLCADAEAGGGEDVGFLAVGVLEEGDAGAAIGIVLDGDDLGLDVTLAALEIDDAVLLLVTTADVTGGEAAMIVAAAGATENFDQGFLGGILGDLVV